MPPEFQLTQETGADDKHVVAVAGEIDLLTAGAVGAEIRPLLDRGFAEVLVDLRDVTFLETAGARMLLECDDAARRQGARLTLTLSGLRDEVRRPLELTGVLDALERDRD